MANRPLKAGAQLNLGTPSRQLVPKQQGEYDAEKAQRPPRLTFGKATKSMLGKAKFPPKLPKVP